MKKLVLSTFILILIVRFSYSQSVTSTVVPTQEETPSSLFLGLNSESLPQVDGRFIDPSNNKVWSTKIVLNQDNTHSIWLEIDGLLLKDIPFSYIMAIYASINNESLIDIENYYGSGIDNLFSKASRNYNDEMFKLDLLKKTRIISTKEFRSLRKQLEKDGTKFSENKANAYFALESSYLSKEINKKQFKAKRDQLLK